MPKKKKIAYGQAVPVRLSKAERALIQDETFIGPEFIEAQKAVELTGGYLRVMLTLDDVEELEGYVAAAGNHCEDKRLEARLDRLFDKLHGALARYDEGEPGEHPASG